MVENWTRAGCYKTAYCNKYHRLADGVPVGHKCRVLDVKYLCAERDGDIDTACQVMETMRVVLHSGIEVEDIEDDGEPPKSTICDRWYRDRQDRHVAA